MCKVSLRYQHVYWRSFIYFVDCFFFYLLTDFCLALYPILKSITPLASLATRYVLQSAIIYFQIFQNDYYYYFRLRNGDSEQEVYEKCPSYMTQRLKPLLEDISSKYSESERNGEKAFNSLLNVFSGYEFSPKGNNTLWYVVEVPERSQKRFGEET